MPSLLHALTYSFASSLSLFKEPSFGLYHDVFCDFVVTSPPCFFKIIIVLPFREQRSPTMASADFSLFVVTTVFAASGPLRVRMITFHSCHCLIYCRRFVQYRTSLCLANSSIYSQPCMRFLFVSASVCVQLPSDSSSRMHPCYSLTVSYCKACSGLLPPSYHPCQAH